MRLKLLAVTSALLLIYSSATHATPIRIATEVLVETVKRTSSLVATYAAAHQISGTGGPGLNPGLCVSGSVIGTGKNCLSSDFFGHPTPPGNDGALASAFASSRLLGFDTIAETHTWSTKGDFAVAGSYAKGGKNVDTSGTVQFNLNVNLGRLALTAAVDPGWSSYELLISDLDPYSTYAPFGVPNTALPAEVAEDGTLWDSVTTNQTLPTERYYWLKLDFNGTTGAFHVQNTSNYLAPGYSLLTDEDFMFDSCISEVDQDSNPVCRPGIVLDPLKYADDQLELLLPGGSADTLISVDALQLDYAVPEPISIALFAVGLGALGHTRRRSSRNQRSA